MTERITRRRFLATVGAGAAGAVAMPWAWGAGPARDGGAVGEEKVCFFFVSDTHFCAEKADPSKLVAKSAETNARLVDLLNTLPGTAIPAEAGGGGGGGGSVGPIRGVIHGGDCIHNGDNASKDATAMQKTEWAAFVEHYGVTGKEAKLRIPVYEVHGNHDGPQGSGVAIDGMIERNRRRTGLTGMSASGLHCSWDWGPVHFVNLGIVVGADPAVKRKRRYNPMGSLPFLAEDLAKNVGTSGRPVILTHHIDIVRHATPADPAAPYDNKEWDACDVAAYHKALVGYNVAGIFFGHTHARKIQAWDGTAKPAAKGGLMLFNVDEAGHFSTTSHAFFYVEVTRERMLVREHATTDDWKTSAWSAATWESRLRAPV